MQDMKLETEETTSCNKCNYTYEREKIDPYDLTTEEISEIDEDDVENDVFDDEKSDESEPESPIRNLFRDLTKVQNEMAVKDNMIDQSDVSTDKPCNLNTSQDMDKMINKDENIADQQQLNTSFKNEKNDESLDNLYMTNQMNQMVADSANQMNMSNVNAKHVTSTPIRRTVKARKPSNPSTKTPKTQKNLPITSTNSIKRYFPSTGSISDSPKTHQDAEDRPSKKQRK